MSAVAQPVTTRPRRSASLAMLIFAMVIILSAFAQVGLVRDHHLPVAVLGYGLGIGALVTIAYLAVARFAPYADPLLLPLAVLLNGLGLAMIYRLDRTTSQVAIDLASKTGKKLVSDASATNQLMWTAMGIAFLIGTVLVLRETRMLQRYTYTIGAASMILLAIPAVLPASMSSALGAKIWIRVGGFSIQPGEFAKIGLVVFFAGYLVIKRDALSLVGRRFLLIDLPRGRDLGPILLAWLLSVLVLVFEKDLGSSLLFFGVFVAMLYIATQRLSWVLIGLVLFFGGATMAYFLFGHVRLRVDIWLHPWEGTRYENEAFQLVQSLYAMATGGTLGAGLGQGKPGIVPLSFSDFIVAAFGEELGLTGLMVILLLFALIVQRGFKAAVDTRDNFAKLFAAGMSFVLALQVFVIVGGVTRLIPLTGLTTPFLSQGGSSLLANWILIGILIRISDAARRPAPQPIQDEGMTQVVRTR